MVHYGGGNQSKNAGKKKVQRNLREGTRSLRPAFERTGGKKAKRTKKKERPAEKSPVSYKNKDQGWHWKRQTEVKKKKATTMCPPL